MLMRSLDDDISNYILSKAPPRIAYFIAWAVMRCKTRSCVGKTCPSCEFFVGIFGKPIKEMQYKRRHCGAAWGANRRRVV